MILRSFAVAAFYGFSTLAAVACPDGQYEDPVTHACLPKSNIQNDVGKGLTDISRGRAPGPAIIGTVGGRRVCIPWC